MKNNIIFLIIEILFLQCYSCAQEPKTITELANKNYLEYKKSFKIKFIDQFPEKIKRQRTDLIYNRNTTDNNVCLILYEYEAEEGDIKRTKSQMESKAIAKYTPKDSCLFVNNRFNYLDADNWVKTKITDSTLINRPCYAKKYPIPNFINYEHPVNTPIRLNSNFTIYVLDSKAGEYDKNYEMKPNKQMPKQWKHGYSKGIALSERDLTIIYWSIMW